MANDFLTQVSNKLQEKVGFEKGESESKWTTNAKWVIGILTILLMVLLSYIITSRIEDGDDLLEALVNFSTILSIVLSVSSIAFAGYTSIETGRQFHFMSRAVEEIRTTNRIMSDNYKDLLNHYHDTVKTFSELMNKQIVSSQSNLMSDGYTNVINSVTNNSEKTSASSEQKQL